MEVLNVNDWILKQQNSSTLNEYLESWTRLVDTQNRRKNAIVGHVHKGGSTYDIEFVLPPGL